MNVKTFEEVRQRFLEITFEERFDLIVAVANGGIIPAAMLNQRLNLDMQLLKSKTIVRPAPVVRGNPVRGKSKGGKTKCDK